MEDRQSESVRRPDPSPANERILVCVGPSPFSARVVRSACRMAGAMRAEWIAATVESASFSEDDRERVKKNLRLAEQLGAQTLTLSGHNVIEELLKYARARKVTKIIAGKPSRPRWRDRLFGSFVDDLIRQSGEIDVHVIKGDAESGEPQQDFRAIAVAKWIGYAWAIAATILCTGLGALMPRSLDHSNVIMVYLLSVVLISIRFGRGPAIFSSLASVAAFDFFFVEPYYTFVVADSKFIITFAVMFIVGILISSMTVQIQRYAHAALLREQRTAALYSMSRQLPGARGSRSLLDIATRHIAEVFDAQVIGLMPDEKGKLTIQTGNIDSFPLNSRELSVAQWVFDLGRPAGMGTDSLTETEAIYVPLNGTRGPLGVIGVQPHRAGRTLSAEQLQLLEAFAAQAALAIESDRFADDAQRAQLNADVEKSRSALLSSVSHDLRTPLSAICGAASSLRDDEDRLSTHAKSELLESINSEANRLSRLVSNLLEMTKLESGAAKVHKELCPLEEVIGSALGRMENALRNHAIRTELPPSLPLLPMDIALMEQVFINILENAAKYTPETSSIELVASSDGRNMRIEIADHGPGIRPGDELKIFEKFYRSEGRQSASGAGLGLAICRAIVEAHGGKIRAENRTGGGAIFILELPLETEKYPVPNLQAT